MPGRLIATCSLGISLLLAGCSTAPAPEAHSKQEGKTVPAKDTEAAPAGVQQVTLHVADMTERLDLF